MQKTGDTLFGGRAQPSKAKMLLSNVYTLKGLKRKLGYMFRGNEQCVMNKRLNRNRILLFLILVAGSVGAASLPATAYPGVKADKVLVVKSERQLYLLRDNKIMGSFRIDLGSSPEGHKIKEGDGRTPEGTYVLDWRNPRSQFYRSIHISYPNDDDQSRARDRGVSPGGLIMIHGFPSHIVGVTRDDLGPDWTNGCIAVTNAEMDVIWSTVDDGTPIEIRP